MLLLYVLQVDTARTYTGGTSEEYLGRIDWRSKGLKIETKLYPNVVSIHPYLILGLVAREPWPVALTVACSRTRDSRTPTEC